MIARALLGKRFRRIDNLLAPNLHPAALRTHSQTDKSTIRVGLFTGCIARVTERAPLQATIQVLEQLGVEVIIPKTQGCCGALHQHDGHPGEARRLATQNQSAFNLQPLDAIIYTASGCGAQLEAVDAGFSAPVMEVCHFLNRYEWPDTATLTPCDKEVQIHSPCSLNHKSEVARILEKIPQLKAAELLHQDCCGAGGSLVLKHPALADRLRNRAIAKLPNKSSPWLVTTNSGCAMHLRAGLKEAQVDTQVLHPIELIARQLTIR